MKPIRIEIQDNNHVPNMRSWIVKNKIDARVGNVVMDPATFTPCVYVHIPDEKEKTVFALRWG